MSAKIDDFDLIKKDEEADKDLVHEMRTVSRISAGARRSLVEHRVASANGSVLKDSGREAMRIALEGEIVGETAKDSMASLRSKYETGEPLSFASDLTTLTQVQKVLIEELRIYQLAGEANHFHYSLALREYVEPPPSDQPPPSQVQQAQEDTEDDSDVRGIRGTVLGPDGKPKQGVKVDVKSDAGEWQLTTDESGRYHMHDPAEGKYTITVDGKGYEKKKRIIVIKKS